MYTFRVQLHARVVSTCGYVYLQSINGILVSLELLVCVGGIAGHLVP